MITAKRAAIVLVATGAAIGGAAGTAPAFGADAVGTATESPGVGSGNVVQVPVDIPVEVVGNSLNVIGVLSPTFGNTGAIMDTPAIPATPDPL
jgi:hypothetical protein